MKCIVIEDDQNSRKLIEVFVTKTDFLQLIASFPDAISAVNFFNRSKKEKIDLVLLDIEMPEMSGFEFLKHIKYLPQIIIISAKEKYALDAFEFDVVDYLLKPITYARFYKAVEKAHQKNTEGSRKQIPNNEIFIKNKSTILHLKYDDILWIEALENYVVVNTFTEKHTLHYTMKSIETKLPASIFRRVHRSYIVNVGRIDSIEDKTIIIKSRDEVKTIPMGKNKKEKLINDLNVIL